MIMRVIRIEVNGIDVTFSKRPRRRRWMKEKLEREIGAERHRNCNRLFVCNIFVCCAPFLLFSLCVCGSIVVLKLVKLTSGWDGQWLSRVG